jgi:hypothetical protein
MSDQGGRQSRPMRSERDRENTNTPTLIRLRFPRLVLIAARSAGLVARETAS